MNDFTEKLKRQLQLVLEGEASLLESAHVHHVDVERIEQKIGELLSIKIIFGSGDQIADLMMGAYMTGRKHQFFASMADLFGEEDFKSAYDQVCIKLGINAKQLN